MSVPIVYVDRSAVREGQLGKLKQAVEGLAAFVETQVPRVISYNVCFDQEGTRMTIIHVHHDSASLQTLMDRAGPLFPEFAPLIELLSIEVYGEPSGAVMEQLRKKSQMLGDARLEVHAPHAGFARAAEAGTHPDRQVSSVDTH